MKFEPHLPQLPSVGELLEHPRVKGIVERINQSTVAQRATGFLDELRVSLADRVGRPELPSMGHLAERLVRRLLGDAAGISPVINATGVVVGSGEAAPPVSDASAHAMLQQAGEYHDGGERWRRKIEQELCHATGAEAALVLNSLDAALSVALAGVASSREVVLAGSPDAKAAGIDWRLAMTRSGVVLRDAARDPEALAASLAGASSLAAVVRSPDANSWWPLADAVAAAQQSRTELIDVAPFAGLIDPQSYGLPAVETIRDRLAAGAGLAIVDVAGLLGGPACGILVGKRSLVEQAARHPWAALAAVDPFRAAALDSTLRAYREDQAGVPFNIPVWQLLSAPIANLQQRAERVAALVAALPNIASAEAQERPSTWLRRGELELAGADWCVVVRSAHRNGPALAAALAAGDRSVTVQHDDESVRLHLRSLFPRWDQELIAAVERANA